MSTVRIQNRRGLAADWASVNPILAGGEPGLETDTNKFKFGNGIDHWNDLPYANITPADFSVDLADFGVSSFNTRHGAVTLTDTDVNTALGYTAADAADVSGLSSQTATDITDAITTAETYTDNTVQYATNHLTESQITSALGYDPADVVNLNNLTSDTSTNISIALSSAKGYTDAIVGSLTTADIPEGINQYFTNQRAKDAISSVTDTGLSYNNSTNKLSNAGVISLNVDSTQLKSNSSRGNIDLSLSDNVSIVNNLSVAGDVTISGNLNIDGVTTTVNSQTLSVVDNLIYLNEPTDATVTAATHNGGTVDYTLDDIGHIAVGQTVVITGAVPAAYNIAASDNVTVQSIDNKKITVNKTVSVAYTSGGTVEVYASLMPDLGLVAGYEDTDNVHKHTGIFRDASTGEWKFFNGYIPEPGVTIDTTDSSFTLADVVAHDISGHNVAASGKFYGDLVGNANSASNADHATSADKLQTPIYINGVMFDGSADINIHSPSAYGLTIGTGLTGRLYTGAADVTIAIDTDTVATLLDSQELYNKTLGNPILINPEFSTILNTGTLTLPTSTDTLVGRTTTDTLVNKTISGGNNTLSDIGNSSLTNSSISINGTSVSLGGSISNLATNSYADNAASSALSTAESYADTKKAEAISAAEGYTDTAISTEVTNRNSAISSAISTEVTNRNSAISSALTTAEGYTDTAKAAAISTSEGYTDSAISTEVTNRNSAILTAKSQAISTSEGYTDTAIATEVTNRNSAISTATANIVKTTDTGSVTSTMISDGTIVNGDISSTAAIAATKIAGTAVTQTDTGTVTSAMIANDTIVNADISSSAAIANSKLANSFVTVNGTSIALGASGTVTAAAETLTGSTLASNVTSSSLTTVGTLGSLAVTGDTSVGGTLTITGDVVVTGNATINGATETVNTSNLVVSDSIIYLADQNFNTDTLDIGFYGAYGTTGHTGDSHVHSGLVRNHVDGKWYLFSNGIEPNSSTVDLTSVTLNTLKLDHIEGNVTGNVTGSVSGNAGTVTNGVYTTDTGTVTNGMLAGSIGNSKLTNSSVTVGSTNISLGATATTLAGLTSVTSTGFTGALTGNADTATKLSTPRNINGVAFDGSAAITITAANPNALTIGTGLSGTSYTGSGGVTIAIDSTVATLTGTQTLTNKTLTSPSISNANLSGTSTYASGGLIQFSDGTQQSTAGVASLTTIATAVAANNTTYYPALDRDKMVPISGTYTLTIAPDGTNTAPVGTSVDFYQSAGTGAAFAAGSGVTILSTPGLKLRTTGSVATIMKTAANTWLLFGDLSA